MAKRSSHPNTSPALAPAANIFKPDIQPSLMQIPSQYQPIMSSHYARAYTHFPVATTPVPWESGSFTLDPSFDQRMAVGSIAMGKQSSQDSMALYTSAAWYQPGNNKCTVKSCNFTASYKTLEIHMMDRHLIYPPGWGKRQKKHEWDADPSLKGKPVPIQGTTLILDSPEVVEAWITERKKRWPSGSRVEEKKRKMEEAIARGQLSVGDDGLRKRQRVDKSYHGDRTGICGRPGTCNQIRGQGTGRGRATDSGWRGRVATSSPKQIPQPVPLIPMCSKNDAATVGARPDIEPETDSEPETVSTKKSLGDTRPLTVMTPDRKGRPAIQLLDPRRTKKVQATKKEPYNPFISRPTLLRNLLLPEIRVTISNLSQAVRFLADNNFLSGVELRVGEADEKKIEVIEQSTSNIYCK